MNNVWNYHDKQLKKLKQIYNRTSKQTQNNLQNIFDSYKIDFKQLYNIANSKTLNRIKTKIEEWKDKGLLNGYFGMLANNIYKKTRIKNREILELLIYGAYIEEQSKLEETELNIFKDVANYYYQQGQEEVNQTLPKKKRKLVSVIPDAIFLALLDMQNEKGYIWKQYLQAVIKYNADQIYRQMVINIQQNKENDIDDRVYQNIITKQQNSKLSINQDKISGAVDNELIRLNNLAKVEGIKSIAEDNSKVRFIATIDGKETDMCHSLDGQTFYINKENVFDRYYGETQKDLRIERIKCFGLVVGLNLPPISHHFYYCRSTITYQVPVENKHKIEYNLDIPKISKEVRPLLQNIKLNKNVKKLFNKYLTKDNVKIDNNLDVAMRYSIDEDKIIINPKHKYFKYYDLSESLSHEIIHMIDIRNNISNRLNIDNELRRTRIDIEINEDKYINLLNSERYEDNMTLGDIFSAITKGKITGNFGHDSNYWIEDISRIGKELSANIMSAYLNNNKDTLDIIDSINGLKEIKEKVVKKYNDYAK